MALGVLNNLSAIYAENNLNNTNASLQTVLQQLSSGSRINSGADDAAGLSLVNGLEANSTALTQSETNATEGVGLLQVADGALSQVTSLLDRAITLATEASNGTLNSTQEGAANQEYQSILSEVNNIGSTTTYNQEQVFNGNSVAIYTGDSSTAGSSIDDLNIRTLSESGLGDTDGVMSYTNGQNNVFVDLSNAGQNAAITDSLGASTATTTINVSYMSQGASGAAVASTAAISVGAGTSYGNTAQGLISAINNSGLGLSATFTTAAQAGDAAVSTATAAADGSGSGSDTGIEITGEGIGAGTSGVGVLGALSLASGHTLGGTLTIVGSDGVSHNIILGTTNSTDTLQNLESTINADGYGVTASVVGNVMKFVSADPAVIVTGTNLTDITPAVPNPSTVITGSVLGSLTVNSVADTLTGNLSVVEGLNALGTTSTIALGGDTLATFAASFSGVGANAGLGITATLNSSTVNGHAAGTILTFTKSAGDAGTASITNSGNITDATAQVNNANAVVTAPGGGNLGTLTVAAAGDLLNGALAIHNGSGVLVPLTLTNQTLAQVETTINGAGNTYPYGIVAVPNQAGTTLTFLETGTNTDQPTIANNGVITDTTPASSATTTIAPSTSLGTLSVGNSSDLLSGILSGVGSDGLTPFQINMTGWTLAQLESTINSDPSYGITATPNQQGTALTFTATSGDAGTPTLGNDGSITVTYPANPTSISLTDTPTPGEADSTTLGSLTLLSTDTLSGSLTIGTNMLTIGSTDNTAATLAAVIDKGNYGVTANYNASSNTMTFVSANSSMTVNTSLLDAAAGGGTPATVGSLTASGVTASAYYSIGVSGTVEDTSTAAQVNGQTTYGGTANVGFTADQNGATGTATTSYSDGAGVSLKGSDLLNQTDAEAGLNDLNLAISDVAAQDGYIGAQINMLNSISQVMSTQQENVVSAQNAIQATDYASATSNMSKYEILSQTGIAALAQANSVQQEVTKLLQ